MSERSVIFVGGLHRSGTTLLARCLAAHPDVSGFSGTDAPEDEGQHLQSVYPPATVYGGPGRFGFAPETHLTEGSPLVTVENRERLFADWSRYWDLGKPVLLEKSPPNLTKTRFLQALFPGAAFVMVVRHPIPVTLATARWRRTRRYHRLVEHWLRCHELFEEDRKRLARCHVLRYEDLVTDPAGELERVLALLGLEAQPATATCDEGSNRRYFERWRALGSAPGMRVYQALTAARYEPRVRRFGYSLREPYELPRKSS